MLLPRTKLHSAADRRRVFGKSDSNLLHPCNHRRLATVAALLWLLVVCASNLAALEYREASDGLDTVYFDTGPTEVEIGDVNGDGCPDLVTVGDHGAPDWTGGQGGLMVWLGNCSTSWTMRQQGNFGYGGVALADVNDDGFLDVGYGIHHNYGTEDFGDQILEVVLGDGSGETWVPWDDGLATNGETWGMFAADFADVNNDGRWDLGACSFGFQNGFRVYLNQGDGTWSQSFASPQGNNGLDFSFGDINRDGNADVVMTFALANVYFGDGTGAFTAADGNLPGTMARRSSVCIGDADGDGGMDVAFILTNELQIRRPQVWRYDTASEQWQDISTNLTPGSYAAVRLCDLNNDGKADLIAARSATGISDIQIYCWDDVAGGWELETTIEIEQLHIMNWMQAGVDADHNGFADLVFFIEHGQWPSTRNRLHCYVESSAPSEPMMIPVRPNGAEVWKGGSVREIRWHSGNPQRQPNPLRLEFSVSGADGPWQRIADDVTDNGVFSWHVPDSISSADCYIRYSNQATAISRTAFEIRATTPGPYLVVTPLELDFGEVPIGSDSARVFRVVNSGSAEMTGSLSTPSGVFQCAEGCGDFNLATGDSQIVTIHFSPGDTLPQMDSIRIESTGGEAMVRFTGRGVVPSSARDVPASPFEFAFHSPYPNPFNSTVRLSFTLPTEDHVRLRVWNILGETVVELLTAKRPSGEHVLSVDARNWSSGLYIFSLETSSAIRVQKAVLLK